MSSKVDQSSRLRKAQMGLLWTLLPKMPLLAGVMLSHVLGMSESAKYLDLETNMTMAVLRSMIGGSKPQSISKTQAMTLLDPGVKGRIWVARVASQVPPETGVRDALLGVIRDLGSDEAKDGDEFAFPFRIPDIVPVEAEWTGYRADAQPGEPLPEHLSEEQKYAEMTKACQDDKTLLYFHGGAYYLCDPSTHRLLAKRLAKHTAGRVYSVRYRLAPQNPFPSALLDALCSYLTLLYPPPGAVHEAVAPHKIVFGGDSAGGNLVLALTQTLLRWREKKVRVAWFGEEREVPLPAGVTLNSPWLDLSQSMPSWQTMQKWDYLPYEVAEPPADHIWPPPEKRKHLFVDDAYLLHPLVCAHLADSWAGMPPVWICCGWECLADEDRYFVKRLRDDGVSVVFEEYEAMPHVFAGVLPKLKETERCIQGWADFINMVTSSGGADDDDGMVVESRYTLVKAKTLDERVGDFDELTEYGVRDVFRMAYGKVGRDGDVPLTLLGPKL